MSAESASRNAREHGGHVAEGADEGGARCIPLELEVAWVEAHAAVLARQAMTNLIGEDLQPTLAARGRRFTYVDVGI